MAFTLRSVGGSKFGGGGVHGERHEKEGKVCGVWGNEGKIYICTNESKRLLVTDTVPRSRWAERYDIILDSTTEHIIAVFQNPRCPYKIYVVYNNSITDCMEYIPSTNQWIKKHSFQLSNAKGARILSISFHQHTSMFFWCEKRGTSLGLTSCCVCLREVPEDWDEDFMVNIGPVVAMLQCCPMMSLFIIKKGVCMVPQLPNEDKQLLFFWTFIPRSLKVYIWNDNMTVNSLDKTDFRSIIMHLLPVWNSCSTVKSDYIISLTTHPTTLELLLLDNAFTLSYACIQDGELCIQQLSKLNLQCDIKTVRSIFAFGLFTGVVFESGIMNIFDLRSGIELCRMEELTGRSLLVWAYAGSVPGVGVWEDEGIWELKSTSISDVAKVMQSSVHINNQNLQDGNNSRCSNAINEEEKLSRSIITCDKCFPEYVYRENIDSTCICHKNISGPIAATQFLKTWNMHPSAAKVALSTAVIKMTGSDTENFQKVEKEHLEILLGKALQSPVASLTLFYQHPHYKQQALLCLKSFLKNWDKKREADDSLSQTALNDLLYHHIKKFVVLTDKSDDLLMTQRTLHNLKSDLVSTRDEIEQLFNRLNLANPDSRLLSRLTYLQSQNANEVCKSVAQTMGFKYEESTAPQEVKISSQRWRKIFRIEWKDGHWHRNRVSLECSSNHSLALLCNLLYNEEPDWLLKVYEGGIGLVHANDTDEKAKDHVSQSMLDCLPSLIVDSKPKSTYVHAILLWTTGQELQAMQVILRHQMWFQALDFFSSLTENTDFFSALFTMMIKTFVRCKAPKEVLFKALSLLPAGFSTYELLSLLQQSGPGLGQPFVDDNQFLTIGDIREQLKSMFTY